jgi:hypothetical protein
MSMLPSYNVFHGVDKLGDSLLIDELEENIKAYLDWGFLNIGGYINVDVPTSGLYGGTFHELKTTEVPGYKIGQVWQGPKKDWVWQSGFYYNDGYFDNNTPNSISGVKVGTNFLPGPTGIATTGYHINYPLGQVIFDKPIPKTSKVELDYSYRWCQVYKSSTDSNWKELQELTYKPAPSINQQTQGDYSISANHRIQMPAIIIEPVANSYSKGFQLGSRAWWVNQDILLHVFTENGADKNRITDIIRLQKESTIDMYDINKVVNNGVYSLNYDGSINPSGLGYHILSSGNGPYYWNSFFVKDIHIMDMESRNKNLYWCTIRLTTETLI